MMYNKPKNTKNVVTKKLTLRSQNTSHAQVVTMASMDDDY